MKYFRILGSNDRETYSLIVEGNSEQLIPLPLRLEYNTLRFELRELDMELITLEEGPSTDNYEDIRKFKRVLYDL